MSRLTVRPGDLSKGQIGPIRVIPNSNHRLFLLFIVRVLLSIISCVLLCVLMIRYSERPGLQPSADMLRGSEEALLDLLKLLRRLRFDSFPSFIHCAFFVTFLCCCPRFCRLPNRNGRNKAKLYYCPDQYRCKI